MLQDEKENDKRHSNSSSKDKKSDEKEQSFTRTREWVNGNFSDTSLDDQLPAPRTVTEPYISDNVRVSREDYLREDPAITDALKKYQPKAFQSDLPRVSQTDRQPQQDSTEAYRRSGGFSSQTRDTYRERDSVPLTSQRESSASRRSHTETLNDVLSPIRSVKPAPITSPIHFSTPQKYGSSKLSGEAIDHRPTGRLLETTPKEHTISSIGRFDEGKQQKTVDDICAEYTSRYKKYDYSDILTDMRSPTVTVKDDKYQADQIAPHIPSVDPEPSYKASCLPSYTSSNRSTQDDWRASDRVQSVNVYPTESTSRADMFEPTQPKLDIHKPDRYLSQSKYDYMTEDPVPVSDEREEGYHPYIPDSKYHSRGRPLPARSSLLRERERAEMENSLMRDKQLSDPVEHEARQKNRDYINQRLSPTRAVNGREQPSLVGQRPANPDVDYRNSYSPDKYGTYKSYKDLVEGEYNMLTKEYEDRAVETRDIERAQAEGVIKPSREYQSQLTTGTTTDVLGYPLAKDVHFVDRHTEDYTSFKRDRPGQTSEVGRKVDVPQTNHSDQEQFSPLYPDQVRFVRLCTAI